MFVYGIQCETYFLIHTTSLWAVLIFPADHIALQTVSPVHDYNPTLIARWIPTVAVKCS